MGFSRQEYWSGVPLPSPKIQYSQINKYFSKRITLRYVRRHCELTSGSTQSLFNSSITFFEFFLLPVLLWHCITLSQNTLFSWMVTNPDSWKHLFLADSCPQAETENTHLISSHSPDIRFRVLVTSSCSCGGPTTFSLFTFKHWRRKWQAADRDAARPLDRGLWFCDLMTPQNYNYLFTCICDVRQAWRTVIICGNLYGSVANDKTTIKSLYRSSPKGLLKCLRKVLFPLVPGDRQGLIRNQ